MFCALYRYRRRKKSEHQFVVAALAVTYANSSMQSLYDCMKTRHTPISPTKTQALVRVLSAVTHGYTYTCTGTVPPSRLQALVAKFDSLYGIAHTKGQRVQNKRNGRANTLFAVYRPPDEYLAEGERLHWILLTTQGTGLEAESLIHVHDRPVWLDYELCRHNDMGEIRWTWRRTYTEMAQLYAELREDLSTQRCGEISRLFERVARQPGFHGVRSQALRLFAYAMSRGYRGPIPQLFFVQKVAHGNPMVIV